jgi:adenylosuccinate lyase
MASGVFDMALQRDLWSTAELREIFGEHARVQRWFDYEAALAQAQASLGLVPEAAAREIAERASEGVIDVERIGAEARVARHPLVPALRALARRCGEDSAQWLHHGPTTQDVLDTGAVLQLRDAHAVFLRDLGRVGGELARLAARYRDSPMAGRTHAVHALPITFGHKCAIWLDELGRHRERLVQVEPRLFVGSMVGAVGTQASFGEHAAELERRLMARLGLGVPAISWQPARDRLVEYAGLLGLLGGTLGKIAGEIVLLSHDEIAELAEPSGEGKVGSSTMPHKRNPAACENIALLGRSLRYAVAFMHEALGSQHERDGVAWKVEWKALPEIGMTVGAMLAQTREVLAGLAVDEARMRANLGLTGGYLLAERVMFVLARAVGRQTAQRWVERAIAEGRARGWSLAEALAADAGIAGALGADQIAAALDPAGYLGPAPARVDALLAQVRADGWAGET